MYITTTYSRFFAVLKALLSVSAGPIFIVWVFIAAIGLIPTILFPPPPEAATLPSELLTRALWYLWFGVSMFAPFALMRAAREGLLARPRPATIGEVLRSSARGFLAIPEALAFESIAFGVMVTCAELFWPTAAPLTLALLTMALCAPIRYELFTSTREWSELARNSGLRSFTHCWLTVPLIGTSGAIAEVITPLVLTHPSLPFFAKLSILTSLGFAIWLIYTASSVTIVEPDELTRGL